MGANEVQKGLDWLGNVAGNFCEVNKAHIYTAVGIGGTVFTGILAAQSGARSARRIDQREQELGRRLTYIEKGKLCWKDAIAPVVMCAVSGYSTFKVDRTLSAELAKRTTMLIASEKAYEKLSEKTKEVLGEKKAKQVQDEIVKEKFDQAVQSGLITNDAFANAPRVGNGQLSMMVDEFSMLPVWSNIDYIALQVNELRAIMADLKPRDPNNDYYDHEVGVYYKEWLRRLGYTDPKIIGTNERKHLGWNKGFAGKHGADDDPIDYYTTAIEWSPGVAVTAIGFTKEPSDMRLGRLIKSSWVG